MGSHELVDISAPGQTFESIGLIPAGEEERFRVPAIFREDVEEFHANFDGLLGHRDRMVVPLNGHSLELTRPPDGTGDGRDVVRSILKYRHKAGRTVDRQVTAHGHTTIDRTDGLLYAHTHIFRPDLDATLVPRIEKQVAPFIERDYTLIRHLSGLLGQFVKKRQLS